MFYTKRVEKIKAHIFMFNNFFPTPENFADCEIVWKKYGRSRQSTDEIEYGACA
jgi:hypothetical protein